MSDSRYESITWLAFATTVLMGGLNPIGVSYSVKELPPFWGAAIRFAPAAIIMFLIMVLRKQRLPTGRALAGAVLYGVTSIGLSFLFLYWGFRQVSPSMAALILAMGPLLTLLLAVVQRLETLRWPALMGTLLSVGGVAVVLLERPSGIHIVSVLAVFLGVLFLSESNIIIKKFPQTDPVSTGAVAMAVGAIMQFVVSFIFAEPHVAPVRSATWTALVYLIIFGSCGMFSLTVFVLKRWPASRASYVLVLMPFVTVPVAALLEHHPIGWDYALGVVLVVLGVYIGAIARPKRKPVLAQALK